MSEQDILLALFEGLVDELEKQGVAARVYRASPAASTETVLMLEDHDVTLYMVEDVQIEIMWCAKNIKREKDDRMSTDFASRRIDLMAPNSIDRILAVITRVIHGGSAEHDYAKT